MGVDGERQGLANGEGPNAWAAGGNEGCCVVDVQVSVGSTDRVPEYVQCTPEVRPERRGEIGLRGVPVDVDCWQVFGEPPLQV